MAYTRVNWEDAPSEKTPLSAENLNVMDEGIENLDNEKLSANGDASSTTVKFSTATTLGAISSGSKLSTLLGTIAKAISSLISHLDDGVSHITSAERTAWNNKVDKVSGKGLSTNDYTTDEKNKLAEIAAGAQVNTITGVKGNAESSYRTGNVNITPANIGLGNVNNTADSAKSVKYATSAGSATSATKATQDASGNVITSTYKTKAESNNIIFTQSDSSAPTDTTALWAHL